MAGLHLTPDILRAAYDFLRATPPFKRWKLPEGETIKFRVSRHRDTYAVCISQADDHEIVMSSLKTGHTSSLICTMAHEMVHLHLHRRGESPHHGVAFKKCAALVCRYHGFDPKAF